MKSPIIFIFLPILFLSCATKVEDPLPDPELFPPEPQIIIEETEEAYEVSLFDHSIYSAFSDIISTEDYPVPAVLQRDLFIEEYFPEDKILRLIEFKKKYFTFNNLSEGGFEENEVTAIFSEDKEYYLGTRRGGVLRYNMESGKSSIIKLPDNTLYNRSITGILSLRGSILISSYAGLFNYDPETGQIALVSGDLSDRGIISMYKMGNDILLGTVKGDLYSWDMTKFKLLASSGGASVSLIASVDNHIVVGLSGRGLYLYSRESSGLASIVEINDDLTDKQVNIAAYFDGLYFIGTRGDGLLVYNSSLDILKEKGRDTIALSSARSDERIYFGTHRDGLLFYDRINGNWNDWGFGEGLSSIYIPSVYFENGKIFISTPDKGIVIINEEIHEKKL